MPSAADINAEFAGALLDASHDVPAAIARRGGCSPARRFAVYRNNVILSLIEALADAYPAICRLVGDEFFRAAARVFVTRSPPASPVLLRYGAGFAEFLKDFPPAGDLPYLADVARLEWAWLCAYHAAEADSLDISALAGLAGDVLPGIVLEMHPSLQIVDSPYPVVTIFSRNRGGDAIDGMDLSDGRQDALVIRPGADVVLHHLPAGGAPFLAALHAGRELAEAAAIARDIAPEFDLASNIAGLFAAGAVIGLAPGQGPHVPDTPTPPANTRKNGATS